MLCRACSQLVKIFYKHELYRILKSGNCYPKKYLVILKHLNNFYCNADLNELKLKLKLDVETFRNIYSFPISFFNNQNIN